MQLYHFDGLSILFMGPAPSFYHAMLWQTLSVLGSRFSVCTHSTHYTHTTITILLYRWYGNLAKNLNENIVIAVMTSSDLALAESNIVYLHIALALYIFVDENVILYSIFDTCHPKQNHLSLLLWSINSSSGEAVQGLIFFRHILLFSMQLTKEITQR